MRLRRNSRLYLLLGAALVSAVFFIDFCNFFYQCGCRSLWAGADAHCNVHQAHSHHCPFCVIGPVWQALTFFAIVGVQALPIYAPARWPWPVRLALALAAFPAAASVLGLAAGLATGYWN
ncbi:MAG TPA: hypothetical protein DEH78_07355 [Solibacterales bacterium]|nr:hypothetical protein [Bryobacterales bacterium]